MPLSASLTKPLWLSFSMSAPTQRSIPFVFSFLSSSRILAKVYLRFLWHFDLPHSFSENTSLRHVAARDHVAAHYHVTARYHVAVCQASAAELAGLTHTASLHLFIFSIFLLCPVAEIHSSPALVALSQMLTKFVLECPNESVS